MYMYAYGLYFKKEFCVVLLGISRKSIFLLLAGGFVLGVLGFVFELTRFCRGLCWFFVAVRPSVLRLGGSDCVRRSSWGV